MAAGIRVIRGPDWQHGEQDGGDGHVGTVVQYGSNGTAQVVWDNGTVVNCRIGQNAKHDLRIFDNATVGVRHTTICDACTENGIVGIRWKCSVCDDLDLCSVCYVTDKHDLTHPFLRIDCAGAKAEPVGKRNRCMKVRSMGIFPGATVVRGKDWKYDNQDGKDTPMAAGIRVIRGPDWQHGEQDGGDGHVGTVVQYGSNGTAQVVWDNGTVVNCRIGQNGKHDLRIFDNATVGVRHTTICDACTENGIVGIRWKCSVCDDLDLCSVCYVTDKHDLTHPFLRIDCAGAKAEPVGKRNRCMKVRSMGIFPGATVVRGKDWKYDNQDGGPGEKGHVTSLSTPTTRSARSIVKVAWETGHKNEYRMGYNGLVELKYIDEAPGPDYYPKHLPLLDATSAAFTSAISNTDSGINEGDKVCIELDEAALKQLQKAAGSWSTGMARLIGKTGTVRGFSQTGDATVEFDSQKWRIVPSALRKVPKLSLGDVVRIIDDEETVKNLQEDHGGWLDVMQKVLGRRGRVVKIDSDGDVAVKFGSRAYLFNPCCCKVEDGEVDEDDDDDDDDDHDDDSDDSDIDETLLRLQLGGGFGNFIAGLTLLEALKDARQQAAGPVVFIKAIVEGDIGAVRSLIQRDSDLVNTVHNGIPALQVAAHEDKLDIVKLLVQHGAQKNRRDKDGDTALVLAIGKSNRGVAVFLINAGVDVNIPNNKGRSPIHIAAYSGQPWIIKLLISKNCDVNAKDMGGDTALHDAVEKINLESVGAILTSPKVDVRITDDGGFMPIHRAAMHENESIVEKIIQKNRLIVNAAKEDGWTALHLAAFNDHANNINVLIKYKADLRAKTGKQQTALHLACEKANFDPVKALVEYGADVNATDKDGDTPLHIVMMGQTGGLLLRLLISQLPRMNEEARVRIATFLIEHGANPDTRNHSNMTPADVCRSDRIKGAVDSFRKSRESGRTTISRGQLVLCSKCQNVRASAVYLPCGHKDTCPRCCKSVRQCGVCGRDVNRRVGEDGKKIGDDCSIQ